ncbi:translocator protein [Nephila pilipes]|uniref:Translocator protein n=1 Tax=Nephila pilipes TaxID=299642 RepID=A0A8X6T5I6_NEPPI|nr:translocator protein [Nephila pilipes]
MLADKLEALDNLRRFLPSAPRRHVKASEILNVGRQAPIFSYVFHHFDFIQSWMEKYRSITGAIALPHLGGIAAAFITRKEVKTWYETLKRPAWRPPNWMFAPMWTSLYTGMGYASYLVWKEGGGFNGPAKIPLMIYGGNLVLNWIWTPIFFGAHKKGLALVEIISLWCTIGICTYSFYPISKTAAYIMLPYWAWVSLASALTYCIWRDNKDKKE